MTFLTFGLYDILIDPTFVVSVILPNFWDLPLAYGTLFVELGLEKCPFKEKDDDSSY